ncbi:MAG: SDR family NAD(P)-dependent oxidoreductase [bacterium]|jgi:NAD(P)-dependent dehydrogenase (short-subunit alcohol dehydrogenase family)|nr:SDR family NAD(P)-dependent oxidoreductase [bacterium]MDD3805334.1 SDR family NAD(P)-dependent oxidoreductase [bacterium]MDD4153261.1 SDR family NAD(P)-dependent oxidoreductase [bacterium]
MRHKSINELISLKGRTALVTGCSQGIGEAIVSRLAQAGASLILVDINRKKLERVRKERCASVNALCMTVDLSKKEAIDALWRDFKEDKPDILINNAGVYPFLDYLEMTADAYKKILDVNLNASFWMCRNFIKQRRKQGGIIINISSIEAILPFKENMVSYSISKAGIIALSRSLARDYAKNGFRVNTILPGAIKTPTTKSLMLEAIFKFKIRLAKTSYLFNNRLPIGHWGEPDDVARAVLFLASDLSCYIQGALLPVDGGFLSA